MKIKSFKNFIRSIVIAFGIILLITLLVTNKTLSHKNVEYKKIYISEGDTLWNIAKENQKNNIYYKNKDIRYIVDDLIKINNLKNCNIKVNQEILIPM